MKSEYIFIAFLGAVSVIFAAAFLGNAYMYKYKQNNSINVTGNAKKEFESDLVKWSAYYERLSMDLSAASEELKKDRELVREFLEKQGIAPDEIRFNAVNIYRETSYRQDAKGSSYSVFAGYRLVQKVTVESKNLDKVDNASREISELISRGVALYSNSPSYYYSKLEDLKLELIAQASENARQRADNIAKKSKSRLRRLIKADLGVFQITGQNEDEQYSYGGVFNTTSRNKTANITVKANYSMR